MEGNTDAGVADFDDEVGELEAVADGAGGGGHVAGEPVDGAAAGVEAHLRHPLPRPPLWWQTTPHRHPLPSCPPFGRLPEDYY